MHELVMRLRELTHQCVKCLDRMKYDELQAYLIERDRLILTIQRTTFTDKEIKDNQDAIKEIISYDPLIIAKMEQLKEEAQNEISKISAAKQRRHVYENYGEYSGAYFDKKK